MVCMIHEDTSFHCCLLLFMAESSSINLFCHWFHYEINLSNEIPFKGRLFPHSCSVVMFFFSVELCRQPNYSDRFQSLLGSRKQSKLYFQLLLNPHCCAFLNLKISVLCAFLFHDVSLRSKSLSEGLAVEMLSWSFAVFVGWMLLGEGCFPVCNKFCFQ